MEGWSEIGFGKVAALGTGVFALMLVGLFSLSSPSPAAPLEEEVAAEPVPLDPLPEWVRHEGTFSPQDTLQDILFEVGFTPAQIHQLVTETKPVYDLNRVRAGHRFVLLHGPDGSFHSLEYQIDDEEFLQVAFLDGRFQAERRKLDLEVRVEGIFGRVRDSLWSTLLSQGESEQLVALLVEVLKWDVDFTALRRGDSFKMLVEKKFLDGEFVKYGDLLAVEFQGGRKKIRAFLFLDPEKGEKKYYNEEGKAVRKALLKVPFHFNPRISSHFSYSRLHPVLKTRRPHLGVDFAAPAGTPVLASGSGTVIFAGWQGGFGKLVKIRHPSRYVTYYAHLSRIDVRVGQRVSQGQRIGRVGATGLATGAHLDYRIQDPRGRFLNPRGTISFPSDEKPIPAEHWSAFVAVRDGFLRQLEKIPEGQSYLSVLMADD